MSKIHIGKKIREVLDNSPINKTDFAKKVGLTRDGAYKIFDKESIATDQLQKISKVLNHDFFSYYQSQLNLVNENTPKYGFADKEEVETLTKLVHSLTKEIEKLRQEVGKKPKSKTKQKKTR